MQLSLDSGRSKTIETLAIEALGLSRFNTRKTRRTEDVEKLAARIKRNGFEITRAPWVIEVDGAFEVFAGGTRYEAAKRAGLEAIPCVVHRGFSDDEISRLADEDNENDEYHAPVPLLDVWAEYHRLAREEGWTQQRIADAKGVHINTVGLRIRLHERLPDTARSAVTDGLFDEGHVEAIAQVVTDVCDLSQWLTTERAQTELVREVLGKHRGSSAGVKPTVKVVREAATRWKTMIAAAVKAHESLEAKWREAFVAELVKRNARSLAEVHSAHNGIKMKMAEEARRAEEEARAAASEAEAEALAKQREAERAARVEAFVSRIVLGDARILAPQAPEGAALVAIDPPYGVDFQSGRRVASAKKSRIANDADPLAAADLTRAVLEAVRPRLAEHATAFVFTGWRHEPLFREAIVAAGYEIKGSLIWVKNNHGTGDLKGSFAPKHERIIHAVKGSPELRVRMPDVLEARDRQNSEHPTEKPEDLLAQLIRATTDEGQMVLDFFAGSGSTLFAAHRLGRDFWGCELDPGWHAKIADRLLETAQRETARGAA